MSDYASGQALRILVISVQEEMRDQLDGALKGWWADSRLFWVSQPELAPGRAQELLPHIILVDLDLGGTGPVPLIRELGVRIPAAPVVALVAREDLEGARQAVLAGARGFLTKPLEVDEFRATLRQTLTQRRAPGREAEAPEASMGRIIVFCAPKGGTGRTSTAVNTAVTLHVESKQPVVLVDADYSAPALDVTLNLHSDQDVTDLLPRLSKLDDELISGVLVTHVSGLQVLLAPPPEDLTAPISLPKIQQILVVLRRMFPWVFVDLGLPLDETAFAFLDGADRIIMTVLPEMVGLRNTRLMLDQLHGRGYGDDKIWLVLNRATMKGGVSGADIETRLRMRLTHRIPDDQPLATYAINRGVPLVMSHRNSAVARAIRALVKHLRESFAEEEPEPAQPAAKKRGLLGARAGSS